MPALEPVDEPAEEPIKHIDEEITKKAAKPKRRLSSGVQSDPELTQSDSSDSSFISKDLRYRIMKQAQAGPRTKRY